MAKRRIKRNRPNIVVPVVKDKLTDEEKQQIITFFNDFAKGHLQLSSKPSHSTMRYSKIRFTRKEISSGTFTNYSDYGYFIDLPDEFYTVENLENLRKCGNLFFKSSKSASADSLKIYNKILNIEINEKLRQLALQETQTNQI